MAEAASEYPKQPKSQLVSLRQCARLLEVSHITMRLWVIDRGCPAEQRPKSQGGKGRTWLLDPQKVRAWRSEHARPSASQVWHEKVKAHQEGEEGTQPESLTKHRTRKAKADADLAEVKAQRARREVASIDLIAREIEGDYTRVRARLLGLPQKLAPILAMEADPARVQFLLEDEIREALLELSDAPWLLDDPEDDELPDAGNGSA